MQRYREIRQSCLLDALQADDAWNRAAPSAASS